MLQDIVDFSQHRAFCFRGEGRCNVVISAKSRRDGIRVVWRLAKANGVGDGASFGMENWQKGSSKCHLIDAYVEHFIAPFLDRHYLISTKLVHIKLSDLHYLAKIPSLPANFKVENFDELTNYLRFPAETSSLQAQCMGTNGFHQQQVEKEERVVAALEMPDATRIPRPLSGVLGPTLTLEIKPKQGFFQMHPGIGQIHAVCNNCLLQLEKWASAEFGTMYDYCPLALFSGDRKRMQAALDSLIADPHRNLRIFIDGDLVHDECSMLDQAQLGQLLFPGHPAADIQTFISAITCILAGVKDDRNANFGFQKGSILRHLLCAQQIDTVGIVRAYRLYQQLPPNVRRELRKKSNLLDRRGGLDFLTKTDPRSLVERYLLAATMKDCSLMINLRQVGRMGTMTAMDGTGGEDGYVQVDGGTLQFAYSIRIVDLDPKSAKNLENAYGRFMAGVAMVRANPNIHPPCINNNNNNDGIRPY